MSETVTIEIEYGIDVEADAHCEVKKCGALPVIRLTTTMSPDDVVRVRVCALHAYAVVCGSAFIAAGLENE